MNFKHLFKPIKIGNMTLRNRSIVPAMGTNFTTTECVVTEQLIDYHREKSKGGFGLIITEVTAVDANGKTSPSTPGLWCDQQIEGYKKLAKAVQEQGGKLCVQLQHPGRQTITSFNNVQPISSSSLPCPKMGEIPREMMTEEVYKMAEKFGEAAKRAQMAGVDAVEIHGAHGYLVAQFMSAYSNKRMDEFGGSLENRMRFPLLIIQEIQKRVGSAFPILFRISAEELCVGGITLPESRAIAKILEKAGVHALDVSAGNYSNEYAWGTSDYPVAYMANLAEEIKKSVTIPVIAVGKINDPYLAEEILSSNRADMIAFGRESIADPHFVNKIFAENLEEISPCIACHQGCTENILSGRQLNCVVNPLVGKEGTCKIEVAKENKKIMIVGGGPAGLEAAWILAKRGHSVTLYEKENVIGGQFRVAAYPPGKSDLIKPLQYYRTMGLKYGVTYKMNTEVTVALIESEKPDVVILATGSTPLLPPIKGIDNPKFVKASEILLGQKIFGRKILIAGGGLVGIETGDFLGTYHRDITVVEMAPEIAKDMNPIVKLSLFERLEKHNIKYHVSTEIKEFLEDGVLVKQGEETKELNGFDTIILAMGVKTYNPLEAVINNLVSEVYVIGDAKKAGKVNEATRQAAELALKI